MVLKHGVLAYGGLWGGGEKGLYTTPGCFDAQFLGFMGSIQHTYLCELELLFDVRNGRLALEAEEAATDQLGVDRVCLHHLTTDVKEGTNLAGRQLTNAGKREKRIREER